MRTSILALVAVLVGLALAVLSVACGRSGAATRSAPPADPIAATFALAYPAKAGDEGEIRRAQDAVRAAPDQASATPAWPGPS